MPDRLLLRNASLLDPELGQLLPQRSVLVENGRVIDVQPGELRVEARALDLGGRVLMPGLIDCHVHVTAVSADLAAMAEWSPAYVTARAGRVLEDMLRRGFTTVRDAAGADYGLAAAIEEGYLQGPRLLFGGKALSQTGGHGDMRGPGRAAIDRCHRAPGLSIVCDGVTEVRRAVRDEIRRGACHIKLMLSGGVASPTDRVDSRQFSEEEVRAAVDEAQAASRYVMGHAYTAEAVNRALRCGVRSIEHGNLIDETSIELLLAQRAFLVPTLVTYEALAARGTEHGLPAASQRKVADVAGAGLHALELAYRAGVQIAFGTDLLGGMHASQLEEFAIRGRVQPPADVIRAATTVAARLLEMEGQVGRVVPGAFADLLVLEGDPLSDLGVLADPGRNLRLLMKEGRIIVNGLAEEHCP